MKCLNCGSETLLAHVQASLAVPLGQKGGSIDLAGQPSVTHVTVKEWWDGTKESPRMIRGPILCADCLEEHVYLKGATPALRKMTYAAAMELGYEALLKEV